MTFEEMRERIMAIDAEELQLREEKETLSKQLREQCPHEVVIETPHEDTMQPRRMCLVCGLDEGGWGCGYKKLNREPVKNIKSRDEFYRYRRLKPLKHIVVPDGLFTKAGT